MPASASQGLSLQVCHCPQPLSALSLNILITKQVRCEETVLALSKRVCSLCSSADEGSEAHLPVLYPACCVCLTDFTSFWLQWWVKLLERLSLNSRYAVMSSQWPLYSYCFLSVSLLLVSLPPNFSLCVDQEARTLMNVPCNMCN